MKKFIQLFTCFAALIVIFWGLGKKNSPLNTASYFDSTFFSQLEELPVSMGGRVMPMSSASADIFKSINGKVGFKDSSGKRVSSTEWLWKLNANFKTFENENIFRTDNRDLQTLLGAHGRYFSSSMLEKNHEKIFEIALDKKSPYALSAQHVLEASIAYGLSGAALGFSYADSTPKLTLQDWYSSINAATKEIEESKNSNRALDKSKLKNASENLKALQNSRDFEEAYKHYLLHIVPLEDGDWLSATGALMKRNLDKNAKEILHTYAELLEDFSKKDETLAKAHLESLTALLRTNPHTDFFRVKFENIFNSLDPFFSAIILYALAFIILLVSLITKNGTAKTLEKVTFILLLFACLTHTFGVFARAYIQMRPPVTNLYSTIVFVGWGSALAALIFAMRSVRRAIYLFSAAASGVVSLIVALNLPHSGDTMGMMAAVLNSNFWLSAHVITIILGYCAVFLAGFLSAFRILAYVAMRVKFNQENSEEFLGNIYAILCFALIFSFLGTMLGGIWADLSWGRFWGWDPKENGALMIILWVAGVLHCKIFHKISSRTFLAMCILGNIIVAWAWFGVNMLGVGLHSYGFMQGGWFYLGLFAFSQIFIASLAFIPHKKAEK